MMIRAKDDGVPVKIDEGFNKGRTRCQVHQGEQRLDLQYRFLTHYSMTRPLRCPMPAHDE